ncbi:hypothetical protein SEA_TONIANN_114 [Gordonia phage Toniann]|nr:hypothetical protein SEA_TONIANN_114 [Gordonia phage Toniann]
MSDTPTPAEITAAHSPDVVLGNKWICTAIGCDWSLRTNDRIKGRQGHAEHVIAALSEHYHLLPKVEAHRMRVGLIDMAPEDEMFPGDDPVLTVRFSASIPQPGRLFDLDELAAALMAAHSSEVSNV